MVAQSEFDEYLDAFCEEDRFQRWLRRYLRSQTTVQRIERETVFRVEPGRLDLADQLLKVIEILRDQDQEHRLITEEQGKRLLKEKTEEIISRFGSDRATLDFATILYRYGPMNAEQVCRHLRRSHLSGSSKRLARATRDHLIPICKPGSTQDPYQLLPETELALEIMGVRRN